MHHFTYRNGVLHVGRDRPCRPRDTGRHAVLLLFDGNAGAWHYQVFADAFADVPSLVCYAMKANSNQAVIATLARLGAGRMSSRAESVKRAPAGIPAQKIMFSGVGKTRSGTRSGGRCRHFSASMSNGAGTRSFLSRLRRRAAASCMSLRVNPDVDARTHKKIATGKSENKFGIPISRARVSMPTLRSCRACTSLASICTSAARSST